jgi:hypothetical protein
MFIPDPRILNLTHPGSRIRNSSKREGWKIFRHAFFCSHKFHIIENYFIFEMLKKIIWANFQRIIELLPKKLSLSSQKYRFGIRDPRSGKKPIPDTGSRGQKSTGSRIRIRNSGLPVPARPTSGLFGQYLQAFLHRAWLLLHFNLFCLTMFVSSVMSYLLLCP